jgi:CRISPR-associated protein Csy1
MAWGHPTTSGSTQMDWYLSVRGDGGFATRSRITWSASRCCPGSNALLKGRPFQGEARRAEFGLPADRNLYLAPQSLFKLHPDNDALIAGVLVRGFPKRSP